MKKIIFLTLLMVCSFGFSQFTTGTVTLTGSSRTLKIDTDATMVTMTLTGPSTAWLGIGFGGNLMASVSDFFIWNSTANRDYTPTTPSINNGHNTPTADDAISQSWTIVSDNVSGTTRTVVATRALVSAGDYTFGNDPSNIQIIFAQGSTTQLGNHGTNPHASQILQRSQLGVKDFSLNATSIYPNPSNGSFNVQTKTNLNQINIYSQTGQFVKTIDVTDKSNKVDVNVIGLSKGIYLIELKNANEKSWKKVIID